MSSINLSPLPSHRAGDESEALKMEREGFVDDAVVLALVNSPRHFRSNAYPADLALAADDLDFAGWQISPSVPVRAPEVPPQVISAIVRRASPPTLEKPETSTPCELSRSGWVAGLVGILSTLLFSGLFATLVSRSHSGPRATDSVEAASVEESSPTHPTRSGSHATFSSIESSLHPR